MSTVVIKCLDCKSDEGTWSRGLCPTCYRRAHRQGVLDEYPTKSFLQDPDQYIRWAFSLFPERIGEVAVEFGITDLDVPKLLRSPEDDAVSSHQ